MGSENNNTKKSEQEGSGLCRLGSVKRGPGKVQVSARFVTKNRAIGNLGGGCVLGVGGGGGLVVGGGGCVLFVGGGGVGGVLVGGGVVGGGVFTSPRAL